jgi:trigger factor
MNITKHDIDSLNAEITIAIAQTDYETKVNEAIKKVQRKASIPGFRPGKVPFGIIKKQYGVQLLVDEVNKILSDALTNYIQEQQLEVLGNALPKPHADIDFEKETNFEFTYEIGLAPQFNVTIDKADTFTFKKALIAEVVVDNRIIEMRQHFGKIINPKTVGENDRLIVDINELDETLAIKPGGIFKNEIVTYSSLTNENAKSKFLGANVGDKIVLKAKELYETNPDKIASLDINSDLFFQLTIKDIFGTIPAELNQELFDKIFGEGTVTNEHEFRDKIQEELNMFNDDSADQVFELEVQNKLITKLNLQLPDAFIKRWLLSISKEPITPEQVEERYPNQSKTLQWQLIKNKLIKDNNLAVEENEVVEEAKKVATENLIKYGYALKESLISEFAKNMLQSKSESIKLYENVASKKVLELVKEKSTLIIQEVSFNDL